MHPRNPYRQSPDFSVLAEAYPALKPHLKATPKGCTIDFKNDTAQRRLTEALLHRDFQISLDIPEDRLCPPVPNRLNYILWLQDIVEATYLAVPLASERRILGVDIGTGASAIYPLLGCRSHPLWCFVATDIDEKSLQYAHRNIEHNNLQDRISLVRSNCDGPVLLHLFDPAILAGTAHYEFTMCNPPFYSSKDDVLHSAEAKEFIPTAVCTGADVEMITPGGEAAFVCKMVLESLETKSRCRWYTSMLGKLSSLNEVVMLLREHRIDNYACTEFVQGQTRRWAVAWSFDDIRLPDSLARITNIALHNVMPPRNTLQQSFPKAETVAHLAAALKPILAAAEGISLQPLSSSDDASLPATDLLVTAARDTWSRAARRKKAGSEATRMQDGVIAALVLRLTCVRQDEGVAGRAIASDCPMIKFNWVKGRDKALYESFVSHVERKVAAALSSNTVLS